MDETTPVRLVLRLLLSLGVLILVGLALPPVAAAGTTAVTQADGPATNVILLIGDGMGANQVEAARWEKAGHDLAAYRTTVLAMDRLAYKGFLSTASASSSITDSAAAATALMTGTRTDNGVIGQDATAVYGVSNGARLTTFAELAKTDGLATGAISTTRLTHATPAGVYAHVNSRENEPLIAAQFLDSDLDIALSGGYSNFLPTNAVDPWGIGGSRSDGRDLVAEARTQGYTVATTASDLAAVPAVPGTRVLGLFASQYMAYESARASTTQPSLAAMTREALDILATDPDGFVLMVEGGQIDTAAHVNNFARMTGEVLAFDDAVATALAFADAHPGTLVIVTADHETGGLTSTRNADGSLTFSFTTTGHSATTVPVRSSGPGTDAFGTATVPNTRVFEVMRGALGLGEATTTPTPVPSTQTASIKFTSTPPGGSIYLDGAYRGTTPATLTGIALGGHAAEIRMPGYQTWTKTVQVTADFIAATYSYNPVLAPGPVTTTPTPTSTAASSPTASIRFTSVPAGGSIYLDGAYRGSTPATIPGIALGSHAVEIRMPGYQTWTRTIQVTSENIGKIYSYNPVLAPVPVTTTPTPTSTAASSPTASIRFTSVPAGGSIYLDGAYRGTTPATIPGIALGTHRAEIRYSGYQSWVKSITVTQDYLSRTCSYNPTLIPA